MFKQATEGGQYTRSVPSKLLDPLILHWWLLGLIVIGDAALLDPPYIAIASRGGGTLFCLHNLYCCVSNILVNRVHCAIVTARLSRFNLYLPNVSGLSSIRIEAYLSTQSPLK